MKQAILSVGKGIDRAIDLLKTFTGYVIFLFMGLLCFQVMMRFVFKHPIYAGGGWAAHTRTPSIPTNKSSHIIITYYYHKPQSFSTVFLPMG